MHVTSRALSVVYSTGFCANHRTGTNISFGLSSGLCTYLIHPHLWLIPSHVVPRVFNELFLTVLFSTEVLNESYRRFLPTDFLNELFSVFFFQRPFFNGIFQQVFLNGRTLSTFFFIISVSTDFCQQRFSTSIFQSTFSTKVFSGSFQQAFLTDFFFLYSDVFTGLFSTAFFFQRPFFFQRTFFNGRFSTNYVCVGCSNSIRFEPEILHGANAGLSKALKYLSPIKVRMSSHYLRGGGMAIRTKYDQQK